MFHVVRSKPQLPVWEGTDQAQTEEPSVNAGPSAPVTLPSPVFLRWEESKPISFKWYRIPQIARWSLSKKKDVLLLKQNSCTELTVILGLLLVFEVPLGKHVHVLVCLGVCRTFGM
jgi:hypothetical protein